MDSHVASKTPVPLPAQAYEKYRGRWIALGADGTSIVASAESLSALEDELVAAGEDPEKVIFDRVEDDDTVLGGAELL
jgi:hypothetical protein